MPTEECPLLLDHIFLVLRTCGHGHFEERQRRMVYKQQGNKKKAENRKAELEALCSGLYLSTTLAGLILSMTMTCLFRCMVVVSVIPSVDPGLFAISTSKGPEAFATVSVKQESI